MKKTWAIAALIFGVVGAVAGALWLNRPSQLETEDWPVENIYMGKTIVTGQRDETRIPGFKLALADVLKKVSGDSAISVDDVPDIQAYVKNFSEHDRMADIPIHDEQGTRDRPFELTVEFERAKVDALLSTSNHQPWGGERPRVVVLLVVKFDSHSYILTADDDQGMDQRDALVATAWQAGVPIALPQGESVSNTKLTPGQLLSGTAEALAQRFAVPRVLLGNIAWKSGMKGWEAHWEFNDGQTSHNWQIQDVNFDDAFRSAMRGTAQILSGHGEPGDGAL